MNPDDDFDIVSHWMHEAERQEDLDEAYNKGVAAERARIVEALAAIHRPYLSGLPFCEGCRMAVDSDGDCPTMRIAKGKPWKP